MEYSNIKQFGWLISLLVLFGALSCVNEEQMPINVDEGGETDLEMFLRAEIHQQYVTRANDNGFADRDQIGVFIVNHKDGNPQELALTGNHADNVRFVYDDTDGKWTGAYQLYWEDKKTPVDAYGYYPFDDALSSVTAYPFSVQRKQNEVVGQTEITGYEASDFLWAKSENLLPSSGLITLKHNHVMAGVQVTLVEGWGFDAGEWEELTKQVVIESTRLDATISLQSGVVSVASGSAAQTITPVEVGEDYRAIVVPQTVEAGLPLMSVTLDGVSYVFKRESPMVYNSGKLHRFTLEVTKSLPVGDYKLNLLDEAILPWQNDPVSHNGAAREYITVHVEDGQYIGDVISSMGLDPKEIINLKLTGTLSEHDHFRYIRENMPYLEAVNLKELRTVNQRSFYWEGWGEAQYGQPQYADDYIPMEAFKQMKYLSYVVWPDNLVGIGDQAFAGCNLRGSLIFPEGLKHIGGSVFEAWNTQMSSLTGELYLPSSLEYVGGGAFNPCDGKKCNLTGEFVLPSGIKFIGEDAFGPCQFLTGKVHIPEKLDILNRGALPENLTGDVRVPQGIKVVNGISKKITSVYFPEGVEEIGREAFWGTETLKGDLAFPSTVKKIGETAFSGTAISHLQLPENLDILEPNSFSWCKYLQDTLYIPSGVTKIKNRAFYECEKLNAVVFPENLQTIEGEAFGNCRSLDYIRCLSVEPPKLDGSAFNGVEKNNFTVVVPPEAVDAYKNADGWKEFKRISGYRNFVCRPMQAGLLNKGDVRTVVLNADGDWTVTDMPSWAHPSVTSGYKKTELTVEIDDLPHGAGMRSGSIVFTLTGKTDEEGNPITCTFDITQYDYEHDEDSEFSLQTASKGNNGGINVMFVGDGYSAKDIYDGSYQADVEEGMEYFFGAEPFRTYRDYFNVNMAVALSCESGVCSNVNIWRETKFNTTYGAGNEGRLLIHPEYVMDYVLNDLENPSINGVNINQSLVICLLNSDVYEGITVLYGTGSAIAFVPHSRYDYPNDFRGLIQHEACGHGFGKLADEYIYHREYIQKCGCNCCDHIDAVLVNKSQGWYRNISLSGKYSDIEWRHLIFHEDYDDIVDIYEGAYFHARGVYRSEVNSCMNNNVPYFSTISRQAIVERIKDYAGEEFLFDDFVTNDSREYGPMTRSVLGEITPTVVLHSSAPVFVEGSPLDYIKTK
mgnify:CR=1 FL=1